MSDTDDAKARRWLLDKTFRSFVEGGVIEIGDKSLNEIIEDFRYAIYETADRDPGFPKFIVDHRDILLENARREVDNGNLEIAATFYAVWIEHTVNGNLINGLRSRDYDEEVIDLLLRKLDQKTKLTVLWRVAGFRQLSDDELRLIKDISEARNSFVHYKWRGHDNAISESIGIRLRTTVERAESLIDVFSETLRTAYWNDREDEIINGFRQHFIDRERDTKPADPPSPS